MRSTNIILFWGKLIFLFSFISPHTQAQFVGITGTGAGINYTSYGTITTNLDQIRPFANTTTTVTVYQDIFVAGFNGALNLDQARLYYKTNSATLGTINDASWSILNATLSAVPADNNDRATFTFDVTTLSLAGTDIMFYVRFTEAGIDYYGFNGTALPHTAQPTNATTQLYKIRFNAATTYNTKRIEGNFADWQANELIHSSAGRDWYVTWDDTHIYVRLAAFGANTDRINIGIDTNPATLHNSDVDNFSGHTFRGYLTPEHIVQSTSITNLNVFSRAGTSWGGATDIYASGSNLWRSGGDAELRIPRSNVGLSTTSNSFALYCWLSNSSDAPYTTFISENPSVWGSRMRSASVWSNSGTGAVVSTSDFIDHNNSETRIAAIGSGFRNLYVSNGTASLNSNTILSGDVIINTSATLQLTGTLGNDLSIAGNLTNNGTFTDNTRAVFLNGTGTQTIGGSTTTTFNFLKLQKSAGIVQLNSNINIAQELTLNDGSNVADLNLNGRNIILQGTSSFIAEDLTNNNVIKDNTATRDTGVQGGYIEASGRTINTTAAQIAGLGVYLETSTGTFNDLLVRRYHYTAGNGLGVRLNYLLSSATIGATGRFIGFRTPIAEENPNSLVINRIYRWSAGVWTTNIGTNPSCGVLGDFCTSGAEIAFSTWTVGSGGSLLPISLISFGAKQVAHQQAQLTWQTAIEKDNLGFEVEKSLDGQQFTKIAFLKGADNSASIQKYTFIDDAFNQSVYYRLKQIDIDGLHYSHSKIVFVKNVNQSSNLSVFPNPTDSKIYLSGLEATENIYLNLLNGQGQVILQTFGNTTNAQETLNNHFEKLPQGIYFLQIRQNNTTSTQKIVKN